LPAGTGAGFPNWCGPGHQGAAGGVLGSAWISWVSRPGRLRASPVPPDRRFDPGTSSGA
jgi:hypothetical protein